MRILPLILATVAAATTLLVLDAIWLGVIAKPFYDSALVATRGAALALVAYGTYDLTNWAVLQGWPVILVPVDIGWGVCLTAVASVVGRATLDRLHGTG